MNRQDWFDQQQARWAKPDNSPVPGSSGRTFRRTRELQCPICRGTFYAYQCDEEPIQPYYNPEPPIVRGISSGARETCRHPLCHAAELKHQQERSPDYQRAVSPRSHEPAEAERPKGKLGRLGGRP